MVTTPYYLSHGAYVCQTGFHWIFLNLPTDQYHAVERRHMEPLLPLLHECAETRTGDMDDIRSADLGDTQKTLFDLIKAGVLTPNPRDGRAVRPLDIARPTQSLGECPHKLSALAGFKESPRIARSLLKAHQSLTRQSSFGTIQRVSRMKAQVRRSDSSPTLPQVASLISMFEAVRPLFPRDYLCLFDSLALLELLMGHGMRVDWVFGVQSDPFAAHCWLQQDSVVLNDSLDRVRDFQPILKV